MYKHGRKQLGMVFQKFSWAIEGGKAAEKIQYNNTVNKKKFKQSWMREKNEVQKNIIIYGQFLREMPETTDEKESWN